MVPDSFLPEWQDIPGFPGYQASTWGQIRSLPRKDNLGKQHKGRVLRQSLNSTGYAAVRCSIEGKQGHQRVHHLVLLTFTGERPEDGLARHMNGNRLDNSLENLRWGTRRDNRRDREFHRTNPGERAPDVWPE